MTEDDLRHIRYIARSCAKQTTFLTEEELYQQGCLEFLLNKDSYEPCKGEFWNYMWIVILSKLKSYIRQKEKPVRIPENRYKEVEIEVVPIRNPETWNKLCRRIEEQTEQELDEIERALTFAPIIDRALKCLTERERLVITLRFGLNGERPHTLEEIGNVIGTHRERARQVENRALRKMRLYVIKEGGEMLED